MCPKVFKSRRASWNPNTLGVEFEIQGGLCFLHRIRSCSIQPFTLFMCFIVFVRTSDSQLIGSRHRQTRSAVTVSPIFWVFCRIQEYVYLRGCPLQRVFRFCITLFLFDLLLSVVLGGQNLAFPDSSVTGNRKRQKSCHTGNPVVLNLWISQCPRKYPKSSAVLMNWSSQPLTFLLCSSGLPGELAPLSLGLRHVLGLTACWLKEILCKLSKEAQYPHQSWEWRLPELPGNEEHRCEILLPHLFWLMQNKEKQG